MKLRNSITRALINYYKRNPQIHQCLPPGMHDACMMLAQKGFTEKREKSCFLILSEPSPPTMCTMMACPRGEQLFGKVEPNHGVPAAVGVHDQHTLLGLRTH
jgi:hypothetical protein